MDKKKTNNPVAKHAKTFNKAHVMKDRKKAMKKGDDRKHKGRRYEDSGDIEERSTTDVISSVLRRGKDKAKYQAAVDAVKSGKYTLSKAAQVFGVRDKVLQDLVSEGTMKEDKKGLWDRIHAKRKRGEAPAKPGDKDYPKTLDVESVQEGKEMHIRMDNFNGPEEKKVLDILRKHEVKGNITYTGETDKGLTFDIKKPAMLNDINKELKKASVSRAVLESKNTPGDGNPCWDTHKKVGTKMKGGKRVNDCVPKNEAVAPTFTYAVYDKSGKLKGASNDEKGAKKMTPVGGQFRKLDKPMKQTEIDQVVKESKTMAALQNMQKNKKIRKEGTSAQSRLDRSAAKHGLGKPNKAASDYEAKLMKKYGAKDLADLRKKMGVKESMDPRDFTDKAGYLVVVKNKKGEEQIKNFFDSKPAAQKYARKVIQGPDTAAVYKTDGRKMQKEDLQELTQRELDMMAKRKDKNLVARGKKKAEPKKKETMRGRSATKQGEDDHIVMQLRKAQDVNGNMDIKVTPTGKTARLPKAMIDKLLKTHDKLSKPEDKRKFRILVTKELRKKAK